MGRALAGRCSLGFGSRFAQTSFRHRWKASVQRRSGNARYLVGTVRFRRVKHRLWTGHGVENRSSGVAFYGERGTLILDRGGWKIYDTPESLTAESSELLAPHLRDFIDCVKSRETPRADLQTGVTSSLLCHLGNASYRVNREIRLHDVASDPEIQAVLNPPSRAGWDLAHATIVS